MNPKYISATAAMLFGAFLYFAATIVSSRAGGLAFDAAGNLFASEEHSISKFTPDGTKSTFATGLNYALGLCFDGSGNLFVSDGGARSIYKFTPEGKKSTFATGISSVGMAFDRAGNLFVSKGDSIFKFTPDGVKSTFIAGLGNPIDLAIDTAGNLLVADMGITDARLGRTILKISPDGTKSTFAPGLSDSLALAVDEAGNLRATQTATPDASSFSILQFRSDGWQSSVTPAVTTFRPSALAVDRSGTLYILNRHAILKFDSGGTWSTFASDGLSPDKRWEFQREGGQWPGIVKAGTTQVVLDLSQNVPHGQDAEVVWAPDSKRFAFNYSPSHISHTTYDTTALYQLRGDTWVQLRSPVDTASKRGQLVQLAKESLPKNAYPRRILDSTPTRDVLTARSWTDANTLILYVRSAWSELKSSYPEAAFLITLKFDAEGNWKVVNTQRTTDR